MNKLESSAPYHPLHKLQYLLSARPTFHSLCLSQLLKKYFKKYFYDSVCPPSLCGTSVLHCLAGYHFLIPLGFTLPQRLICASVGMNLPREDRAEAQQFFQLINSNTYHYLQSKI